jgi:hypothetical protein
LGRVRLDIYQQNFSGNLFGNFTKGFQPIIIPSEGEQVRLTIISVGSSTVPLSPTGILATPDSIISAQQNNPVPVVVQCSNLALNNPVTVTVKPAEGISVTGIGYNNVGSQASSTATVLVKMPRGGGLIYATVGLTKIGP